MTDEERREGLWASVAWGRWGAIGGTAPATGTAGRDGGTDCVETLTEV